MSSGRAVALAIGSGFATFVVVASLVGALIHGGGGFTVLFGGLVGAIAGAIATAGVTAALTGDVPTRQRRLGGGFGGFMVGFVATAAVTARFLPLGGDATIAAGVVVGILVGIWGSKQGESLHFDEDS